VRYRGMVYSDVVNNGWILPKKKKYTMRDVNNIVVDSLFTRGSTLSTRTAVFIVKCSAIYHDTDYSNSVMRYNEKHPLGL
jgi:hypothetical protein